ncbi:MAG: Type II secretion system protein, PilC [Parcubacteria group bacterium GW2011_GWA1_44_13]|nr:MAG: Type II secretion system protein, PilC [Parcubacteria group bacterium GW2011_GWA1_44_13]KKT59549.1 MAG: Type II secretion system protein, PilC [Parcubacteria group bacterium GW2011_GWC1_44_26]
MIFIYEVYNKDGATVRGEYEAGSREEVVQYLLRRDLTPISVEAIRGGKAGLDLSISLFEKIKSVDILFLVRNLSATVKAGLSIVEALDILIADTEKKMMKNILREVQALVKNGQPLSAGFANFANQFPPVFLGMLRAGEASGQLERTLTELGQYLSKEYALRAKVKSALTYPIILLVASIGVVSLLLIFVLPRLTKAFASSGVELPWVTKFFLGLSSMLTYSFTLDLIVVFFATWFFLYFRKTTIGRKFFFFLISHIPVANELIKKVALVRFTRTLGNLMASGLSAVGSLESAAQSIGNQKYEVAIKAIVDDVKNGMSISDALTKFPDLFPRLLVSLVIVGERTGSLSEILITFSDFYEEDVDNKLKGLTAVLEPILLLIMGLLVGSIAFSIILPIYQLVGHFT